MSEIWAQLDPIPRGPAIAIRSLVGACIDYYGGRPRCPKCLSWKYVRENGYNVTRKHGGNFLGFHCNRCKVWWRDTDTALCFICNDPYLIPSAPYVAFEVYYEKEGHSISYHHNRIDYPFCPSCQEKVGNDRTSNRSGLRKLVGC